MKSHEKRQDHSEREAVLYYNIIWGPQSLHPDLRKPPPGLLRTLQQMVNSRQPSQGCLFIAASSRQSPRGSLLKAISSRQPPQGSLLVAASSIEGPGGDDKVQGCQAPRKPKMATPEPTLDVNKQIRSKLQSRSVKQKQLAKDAGLCPEASRESTNT